MCWPTKGHTMLRYLRRVDHSQVAAVFSITDEVFSGRTEEDRETHGLQFEAVDIVEGTEKKEPRGRFLRVYGGNGYNAEQLLVTVDFWGISRYRITVQAWYVDGEGFERSPYRETIITHLPLSKDDKTILQDMVGSAYFSFYNTRRLQ